MRLTKSEDCFKCRDCCAFYKEGDDRDASPTFTPEERLDADSIVSGENFIYLPKKKLYQAKLVDYAIDGPDTEFLACIFLNQDTHACKIYAVRPFDCVIWPYIIIRDAKGRIGLRLYHKTHCPSMNKQDDEAIKKHSAYFSEELKKHYPMLKKNPSLILDYDTDYFEMTDHVTFLD